MKHTIWLVLQLSLFAVLAGAQEPKVIPSLQAELDARKAEFEANSPPETVALFNQGVEKIRVSRITGHALKAGDAAPDFELPNAKGGTLRLSERLSNGPVVIVWYRGGWCPYCNLQLKAMQDVLPEIEILGGALVAISPETPDHTVSTAEKAELAFDVLSDADNHVARSYGLVYTMDPEVAAKINESVKLADYNGNDRNEFPLAATFVVATNGAIHYAFADADYRKRAEPAAVLQVLENLSRP